MDKGSRYGVNTWQRLGKTILNLGLFIALAFFFTGEFPVSESHLHSAKETRCTGLHTSLSAGIGNFYRTPTNHPKETGPVLANITEPEAEDDIQIDNTGFHSLISYFISALRQQSSETILSALPSPFLQNRPTVPLFVLFHSWKNFIR